MVLNSFNKLYDGTEFTTTPNINVHGFPGLKYQRLEKVVTENDIKRAVLELEGTRRLKQMGSRPSSFNHSGILSRLKLLRW